jgi:hypothetical protein
MNCAITIKVYFAYYSTRRTPLKYTQMSLLTVLFQKYAYIKTISEEDLTECITILPIKR